MDECTVICPVCSRDFPKNKIEEHADKCLFLNSANATPNSDVMKRIRSERQSSAVEVSPPKKFKKSPNQTGHSSKLSNNWFKNSKKEHGNCLQTKSASKSSSEVEAPFEKESSPPIPSFFGKRKKESEIKDNKLEFNIPLADMVRPKTVAEFFGQSSILGQNTALRSLLDNQEIPNMILWGPPGSGKTSLAAVIRQICKSNSQKLRYVTLNAADAGVKEVKTLVEGAKVQKQFGKKTILFMDEIHRFNKRQQDTFLSCVEKGDIVLVGATTENPSFSINNALLSRCRVVVFEKLPTKDVVSILTRAVEYLDLKVQSEAELNDVMDELKMHSNALTWLADTSDGDARIALSNLQLVLQYYKSAGVKKLVTESDIKEAVKKSHMLYDRNGEEHYNLISAMHKSIRGSDDNAAVYWTTRMIVSGEDPLYIARRMVRAASEDIGNADPRALQLAINTMQGVQLLGMPEADVLLTQCAIYLARAPKTREADNALAAAKVMINNHKGPQPSVPMHIRNAPTKLMKDLGYGKLEKDTRASFLPKGYENANFFK